MIKMIVAYSKNGVIGNEGRIPWRLSNDMQFFRRTTMGNSVVMGRKTYDSIGKPLPGRQNIVITRDRLFNAPGVTVVHSPEDALRVPKQGDTFVIGGEQIYRALLPLAQEIYVTVVDAELDGDARFPRLGPDWSWTPLQHAKADENNDYNHTIYRVTRSDPQKGPAGDISG